jgi:hypothetical protein
MNDTLTQLDALIATGTETEVRQFIRDHFNELPEKMQQSLAIRALTDTLEQDLQDRKVIGELKAEALEAIAMLEESEQR